MTLSLEKKEKKAEETVQSIKLLSHKFGDGVDSRGIKDEC